MTSLVKILIAIVLCIFVINFPVTESVESRTNPTATKSRTRTATATASTTPSLTATNTITPSRTVTSSPTMTLTPSPTPVQKTEILLFENLELKSHQSLSSEIIDVSNFSEVSMFLATNLGADRGSGVEVRCHFLPRGGNTSFRYDTTYLFIVNRSSGHKMDYTNLVNNRIIGPRLVCDLKNYHDNSLVISFYLYLIP